MARSRKTKHFRRTMNSRGSRVDNNDEDEENDEDVDVNDILSDNEDDDEEGNEDVDGCE